MDLNEYQNRAKQTNLEVMIGKKFVYSTLGLASEAGELAGKVKKIFRDNNGNVDDEVREKIKSELGDVLWYVAQVATDFGLSLGDIGEQNIEKLASRMERGTLHGDGDNR